MASEFAVFAEGLGGIDLTNLDKEDIQSAASKAINTITRNARTKGAREIRKQVNLPARYVSPSGKGFYVSQTASPARLEGIITARGQTHVCLPGSSKAAPKPGKSRRPPRSSLPGVPGLCDGPLSPTSGALGAPFDSGLAKNRRFTSDSGLRPGERLPPPTRSRCAAFRGGKDRQLYLLYGPRSIRSFSAPGRDGTGVANRHGARDRTSNLSNRRFFSWLLDLCDMPTSDNPPTSYTKRLRPAPRRNQADVRCLPGDHARATGSTSWFTFGRGVRGTRPGREIGSSGAGPGPFGGKSWDPDPGPCCPCAGEVPDPAGSCYSEPRLDSRRVVIARRLGSLVVQEGFFERRPGESQPLQTPGPNVGPWRM